MKFLPWTYRKRHFLLSGLALATAGYGVMIIVVPWRHCHATGYVLASVVVLTIFAVDAAVWKERRS